MSNDHAAPGRPRSNANLANARHESQLVNQISRNLFILQKTPTGSGPRPTSRDIGNIVLALTVKALVTSEIAGQGASPTAATRSSALLPKEYLSDMLPKKVST